MTTYPFDWGEFEAEAADPANHIAFTPVPRQRKRRAGWSPERQRLFLFALSRCGSVARAARSVGMTPRSAYRLPAGLVATASWAGPRGRDGARPKTAPTRRLPARRSLGLSCDFSPLRPPPSLIASSDYLPGQPTGPYIFRPKGAYGSRY